MKTLLMLSLLFAGAGKIDPRFDPTIGDVLGWISAPPDELELARAAAAAELAKLSLATPNVTVPNVADPYEFDNYPDFRTAVRASGKGVLVVGVPDRYTGTSTVHCRVESGFRGYADGEWDFWVEGKDVWVRAKPKEVKPNLASPFAVIPSIRDTPAQPVATSPRRDKGPGSSAGTPGTASTSTVAHGAAVLGGTSSDCPTGQP